MTSRSVLGSLRRHAWPIGRLVCGSAAAIGLMAALSADVSAQPVTVTQNPPLTARCGALRVMLVLDESASISASDVTLTRQAADAFVGGLRDTGTELGVTSFAVGARNLTTSPVYRPVTDATVGAFTSAINGFATNVPNSRNGTNWDDAFRLVRSNDVAQPPANLVVFMTDGNPNTVGTPPNNTTPTENETGWTAATPASITSANSVKAQGTHIFAIGVGAALTSANSLARLQWISGPNEFPEHSDFATADYTLVSDFAGLRTALSAVVSRLCGASLTITKWVSDEHGGPWTESPGWKFTTALDTPHEWLDPDVGTADSAEKTTNDGGVAEFHWLIPHPDATVTLAVTHEKEKDGFHFVFSQCVLHRLSADGDIIETEYPPGGSTTGIPGATLGKEEFITCDVYNSPEHAGGGGGGEEGETAVDEPHLVVHKTMPAQAQVGEHVPVTITVHNHGTAPAHDVRLFETPPDGGNFVSVADGGSIKSDGTVVWHIASLAPGESRTVHATMLVTRTGVLLNTVVADAADGDPAVDNDPVRVRPAPSPTFTG